MDGFGVPRTKALQDRHHGVCCTRTNYVANSVFQNLALRINGTVIMIQMSACAAGVIRPHYHTGKVSAEVFLPLKSSQCTKKNIVSTVELCVPAISTILSHSAGIKVLFLLLWINTDVSIGSLGYTGWAPPLPFAMTFPTAAR